MADLISKVFNKEIPSEFIFKSPSLKEYAWKIELYLENKKDKGILYSDLFWIWRNKETLFDIKVSKDLAVDNNQYKNPKAVFLTGATGFVGAFVLKSLLEDTKAKIYCHVRADSNEEGLSRIKENLKRYDIWNDVYERKIKIVPGDLGKKLLGMDKALFEEIALNADSIFHVGANVNHLLAFEELKASNVLATEIILQLASMKKKKPLHFISTTDIFEIQEEIKEDDNLLNSKLLFNGYAQSKWVAERIIKKAREQGCAVSIYRLSRISGSTTTGMGPVSDFFWKLIQVSCYTGFFPDLDIKENITPVDFVADALVYISKQPEYINKNYHLFNSEQVSYSDFFSYLQNYGFSLKKLEYDKWKNKLVDKLSNTSLKHLVPLFSEFNLATMTQKVNFNCQNKERALQNFEGEKTNLNEKLFDKYLDYYIKIGFLKK